MNRVLFAAGLVAGFPLGVAWTGAAAAAAESSVADNGLFATVDANGDGQLEPSEAPEEQRRLVERLLRLGDRDGDGKLNPAEFERALTPTTAAKPIEQQATGDTPGADATRLLLLRLDTDRDTRLTRGEAPDALRPTFDRLVEQIDRNQDGELDRTELSRAGARLGRQSRTAARQLGWEVDAELRRAVADQGADADRFDRQYNPERSLADPKQAAELFKQLDADRDGQLVVDELPNQLQQRMGRLLRRADADQSGGVSKREFLTAADRISRFNRAQQRVMDQPGSPSNTSTTSDSLGKASPPGKRAFAGGFARRMLNRMDRNGDGVIARSEARRRLAERFDEADLDGNGQIDPAEIDVIVEMLSERQRNVE